MEAFFITRGKTDEVEQFKHWISTVLLPLKCKRGDGTEYQQAIDCQLRPVQFWGFVFPKEYKDIVVNSLGLYSEGNPFMSGYDINSKLWAIRKLLGATKFEKPKDINSKLALPYQRWQNVNILGIGYREEGDIADLIHERI